jgi:uncharacterized phiE125 gp8 family phage protein
MNVTVLVAPAAEPLALADAKSYLRIAYDGEDALVAGLIAAARARIEELAGVAMISRTLRVMLHRWPSGALERRSVRLPVRPADELVAVRVFNADSEAETVTERFALSRGRAARVSWVSGAFPWPRRRFDGIEIDYRAGFGAAPADVAEGLRLAVKRLVAHGYHARDAETIAGPLPQDVAGLVSPWRRVTL